MRCGRDGRIETYWCIKGRDVALNEVSATDMELEKKLSAYCKRNGKTCRIDKSEKTK